MLGCEVASRRVLETTLRAQTLKNGDEPQDGRFYVSRPRAAALEAEITLVFACVASYTHGAWPCASPSAGSGMWIAV